MPPIELSSFDYIAFLAMAVVFFGAIYLVIWIGDLPAKIASRRKHPQVAAIQAMAWLGLLFTGGVVYILAFVWAYYDSSPNMTKSEDDLAQPITQRPDAVSDELNVLRARVAALETKLGRQRKGED